MTDMVAVAYPSEVVARQALTELHALHTEHVLHLTDVALVTRDQGGVVKIEDQPDRTVDGAVGGAIWGGLIGLLLLQPLLGAAIGAAVGGIGGAAADDSEQTKFIKKLGERLAPGTAAVIALVADGTMDKALPRIAQHGGTVLHTSLSDADERQISQALSGSGRAESPAVNS